ncbi:MAG: hypothetical protein ACM31P_04265 [Actinomycetota bacterium]
MKQNPFSPPKSRIADVSGSSTVHPPKPLVIAAVALFSIHIAIFANYFGMYFELVRTGAIPALGPLFGLVADIVLFFAMALLLFKRCIKPLFLAAGAGLLLANGLTWNVPFDRAFILVTYGLGAAVAFFGWWVATHQKRIGI